MGKKLSARDREIVRMYFKEGETMERIGEKYGISRQRVGAILKKPETVKELDRMKTTSRELARAKMMMNADRAADVMIRLLESKNENQQYLAALDVMNRAKIEEQKAEERIEIVFVNGTVEIGEEGNADSDTIRSDGKAEDVSRERGA